MDKELEYLLKEYKESFKELNEINFKIKKVTASETIANTLTPKTITDEEETNKKINEIIIKLKTDVDLVLNKRKLKVENCKKSIQKFLDTIIWQLFSRTELQNNSLLFNNDSKRIKDKNNLLKLISVLFNIEREVQVEKISLLDYSSQIQLWLTQLISIYIRMANFNEKKDVLVLLFNTPNIHTWAIPFIQFNINTKNQIEEYLEILNIILIIDKEPIWNEDDYLSVLDQLAIDFNFNKFLETIDFQQSSILLLFQITQTLFNSIFTAIKSLNQMNSLVKRLSQTIIQITNLIIDTLQEKELDHQLELDNLLRHIITHFFNLKQSGWFFLTHIPFKVLSINALWDTMIQILQLKYDSKPNTLNDVLNHNLPNTTRFQYILHENQLQGYFMLTCLTNIVISLPQDQNHILSTTIISIISYTLFIIAFIDKDLRELFYKDVRDNLSIITKKHSFVISLLFQWTVENMSVMERMSLYLFHSISLDQWVLSKNDLVRLHTLLTSNPLTSIPFTPQQIAQIQLAKHILSNLNYHYKDPLDQNISNSQPWHTRRLPFLNYETHQDIAFILLDACQQFQPLPDLTSTVSSYLPVTDQILLLKSSYSTGTKENINLNHQQGTTAHDFIQWSWSIALRLQLYDCPLSSRATEIDSTIDLPFLKHTLNHSASHSSSASHSALIVYLSFLLSASSRHFLRFESSHGWMKLLVILKRGRPEAIIQILSHIVPSFVYMHGDDFFNDESWVDFFRHLVEFRPDPMLVKAAQKPGETGLGLIVGAHVWQAHLIDSVSDLMDDQGKGFSYLDLMLHSWLKTVFRRSDWMWQAGYVSVVDSLTQLAFVLGRHRIVLRMLEEEGRRLESAKVQQSSPRLTRFLKNMVLPEGAFSSLLMGEWSILKVNYSKSPGIETQSFWFAFIVLWMETQAEKEDRKVLVETFLTSQEHDLSFLLKNTKKPIEFFAIYRWLQHILVLPLHHPLLPLYCQFFLYLYRLPLDDKTRLGHLFFQRKADLLSKLRDHLANVQTYYSQKLTEAGSGHTGRDPELLRQFYYAMWLWLGQPDEAGEDDRLCLEGEPWDQLWLDLVGLDGLERGFLEFGWEGTEKFRTDLYPKSLDDRFSLSTTTTTRRRLKLITDESTIAPLPPLLIHTPSTSTHSLEKKEGSI